MGAEMSAEAIETRRAYQREYRRKNREKINSQRKNWRAENRDKVQQYNKEYWERRTYHFVGDKGTFLRACGVS